LQGQGITHPPLGEIQFRQRSLRKALQRSTDPRKLQLFAKLDEIVGGGEVIGGFETMPGALRRQRVSCEGRYILHSDADLAGEHLTVRIEIAQDQQGRLYHDHMLSREGARSPEPVIRRPKGGAGSEDPESGTLYQEVQPDGDDSNFLMVDRDSAGAVSGLMQPLADGRALIRLFQDAEEVSTAQLGVADATWWPAPNPTAGPDGDGNPKDSRVEKVQMGG